MSELLDWDEDEHEGGNRSTRAVEALRRWSTMLTALLVALSGGALLGAAGWLQHADLGTRLRERSCDASPLPALGLFVLAGFLTMLAPRIARLSDPSTTVSLHASTGLFAAPAPVALFIASLPGTLGCAFAGDIAENDLLGPALTGNGGVILCVASAVAIGAALAHVIEVNSADPSARDAEPPQPTIVELAMAEADELERDDELRRFRGVD